MATLTFPDSYPELKEALDALDALPAPAEPEGEVVEVMAWVERSESGEVIRVYGVSYDGGVTWVQPTGMTHIATIRARVPLPRVPEVVGEVG